MEKECLLGKMEGDMKENIIKTKKRVLGFSNGQMEDSIKDNG